MKPMCSGRIRHRKFIILLCSLGFTTILAQLVILREFLNVFEGNELVIGLFLSIWMILTAAGSIVESKKRVLKGRSGALAWMLLLISCLPFIEIVLLYYFESLLFPPGIEKGLTSMASLGFVLLLPVCFLSGMFFSVIAFNYSEFKGSNQTSNAYGWESAGSIIAGILFSSALASLFSTFKLLALITALNILVCFFIWLSDKKVISGIVIAIIVSIFLIVMVSLEKKLDKIHFNNQDIVLSQETPYGNISVTGTSNHFNLYLNSKVVIFSDDYYAEEPVHFVLLQHSKPERVLIVSGGFKMIRETLKYPSIRNVDYVDLNPWLFKAEKTYGNDITGEQVRFFIKDPRRVISQTKDYYDAIIVNAPDPSSAQINRLFTKEFFKETKAALRIGGLFGISLSSSGNYMNDESLSLNGMILNTLRSVFRHVIVIPGERNYFVASDNVVSAQICHMVHDAGISNEYVNSYYFNDELLKQRSDEILYNINQQHYPENTDFFPRAYLLNIGHWLIKSEGKVYGSSLFIAIVIMMVLLVLFLSEKSSFRNSSGVFTSAFAGASAEFLLLFLFQVLYGSIYQMLGLLVACYMAGLVAGSMINIEKWKLVYQVVYFRIQITLIVLLFVLPAFAYIVTVKDFLPDFAVPVALFVLTTGIAFSTGLIFNIASKMQSVNVRRAAGSLYGIDLAGSAAGLLFTSVILLPLSGMLWSSLIPAGLVAISALCAKVSLR